MSDAEWVLDLRSCLTSVKDGIPLHHIESDLLNLTGSRIPYKNLGYTSLEACLNSTGQFTIHNRGGVSIVYAVASNKTQHLTDLIKKQKSKPPKKKTNLKKNLEKIKISKSRKRNISECKEFSLCDKVTKYHKSNNINRMLSSIEQWDIKVPNQYKSISKFECLVCYFKTNVFNDWKLHIMSISHMSDCHKANNLYSYVCSSKGCKVLLYGPEESLNIHRAKHLENGSGRITGVPIFMAEVMKRFNTKQNTMIHYCSHCKKYDEKPIHSNNTDIIKYIKCPVEYYCKYCRVNFFSSPEMMDYHSLSVEHLTLKCYHKLCLEGNMDSKKIKKFEQSNEIKEDNLFSTVENKIITNSIPLPKDISLFKNCDYTGVDNKWMRTVLVNKNVPNVDVGSISFIDQKSQELNPVNSKTALNKIIDRRLQFNDASTCAKTASDNVTNFEKEKSDELDEDKAYGEYVTQRLKNIKNKTVKQDIKLEIDYLFYIHKTKLLQKNV